MSGEKREIQVMSHQNHMINTFAQLYHEDCLTDVTLSCCDAPLIKAHKLVLSSWSDYFRQLFTNLNDKYPVVFMKDIPYDDLRIIIDLMYIGRATLTEAQQLDSIIAAAEALRIKILPQFLDGSGNNETKNIAISNKQNFSNNNIQKTVRTNSCGESSSQNARTGAAEMNFKGPPPLKRMEIKKEPEEPVDFPDEEKQDAFCSEQERMMVQVNPNDLLAMCDSEDDFDENELPEEDSILSPKSVSFDLHDSLDENLSPSPQMPTLTLGPMKQFEYEPLIPDHMYGVEIKKEKSSSDESESDPEGDLMEKQKTLIPQRRSSQGERNMSSSSKRMQTEKHEEKKKENLSKSHSSSSCKTQSIKRPIPVQKEISQSRPSDYLQDGDNSHKKKRGNYRCVKCDKTYSSHQVSFCLFAFSFIC